LNLSRLDTRQNADTKRIPTSRGFTHEESHISARCTPVTRPQLSFPASHPTPSSPRVEIHFPCSENAMDTQHSFTPVASAPGHNQDGDCQCAVCFCVAPEHSYTELPRRVERLEKGMEAIQEVVTQSSPVSVSLCRSRFHVFSQTLQEMKSDLTGEQNRTPDCPSPVNICSNSVTINMDSYNVHNMNNSNSHNDHSNNNHSIRSRDHLAGNSCQMRIVNLKETSRQSSSEEQPEIPFQSSFVSR
jgi:hypothetical protein